MSSNVRDEVLAELRRKKVKLWLPPYWMGKHPNRASLQRFADTLSGVGSTEDVMQVLLDLQAHALQKLEKKKNPDVESLEVKILGLQGPTLTKEDLPTSWAEKVEVSGNSIHLYGVRSDLTASALMEHILHALKADAARLVFKGSSISSDNHVRLSSVVNGASPTKMLCLVSYKKEDDEDRTLISCIKGAAQKLGRNQFDVTDQHGNIVSMSPAERLAFLTAIGLHRLGCKRSTPASTLVFLLEADKEWDNVPPRWRDQVDNYGLLQLDIAWVYLKLESLENLTDVLRRLEVAEAVLRKQVHTNFVTLAIAQAEMGNAVPPLSAVFCRLFLLQGVAYKFLQDKKKSSERLDWAWALCQSLRNVSSIDRIEGLCEALGISQSQAISALRRSNGNSDQAATLVEEETVEEERQDIRRAQQRRLGLCENTVDHVNLDLVSQVQTVLGLEADASAAGKEREWQGEMDSSFVLAAGLLRLSNNDLQQSIDIYQDVQRSQSAVLERVAVLDERLVAQGLAQKKKRPRKVEQTVDEISLVTLLSMGIDESVARKALLGSENNVDKAWLWLATKSESEGTSTSETNDTADAVEASTNNTADAVEASTNDTADAVEASRETDDAASLETSRAEITKLKSVDASETRPIHSMDIEASDESDETEKSSKRARYQELEEEKAKLQAELLLEKELGEALQDRDLEKEYFGSKLDEEWSFIEKFRAMS